MDATTIKTRLEELAQQAAAADAEWVSDYCAILETRPTDTVCGPHLTIRLDSDDPAEIRLHGPEAQSSGDGVPMAQWHGVSRRYDLPTYAKGRAVAEFLRDSDVAAALTRILAGGTVEWDGSNNKGSLDDDAMDADYDLEIEIDRFEDRIQGDPTSTISVWDAGDFFVDGLPEEIPQVTAESTDDDLGAIEEAIEAEAWDEADGVYGIAAYLKRVRDEARDAAEDE